MSHQDADTVGDPRHQQLVAILVGHGLTELVAWATIALGERLRALMIREPDPDRQREHGSILDAQTGEPVGPAVAGTRTGVSFAELVSLARDRGIASIVGVHTHPGSSSLSDADGALLANAPLVAAMVVAGADGTWYVLSAEPGTTPPTREEIRERYEEVFDLLAPAYGALSYAGSLTEERAWQDLTHDIWDAIAAGLGLRYDRVTPIRVGALGDEG